MLSTQSIKQPRWLSVGEKKLKLLSHVQLFTTPWTVAYQAPPSMGFSRQEYCSGLPLPSPFFCYVQPTEVADTGREDQSLLFYLNTHTCYYRVHSHKHAASPLPPLLPLPPCLLISLLPCPFLPSFSFSSVNEISVHTLLRNLSSLI